MEKFYSLMTAYLNHHQELIDIMRTLISPGGCPWDMKQTHQSLKHYLIEEAYELLEAIEEDNPKKIEEEIGDLYLQVIMHSLVAEKTGKFSLDSVTTRVSEKMIRRHPHVFGKKEVDSVDEVWKNWDNIKRKEKGEEQKASSLLANIPKVLPALLRSEKIQKRAARVGFDWQNIEKVWDKVHEEFAELRLETDRPEIDTAKVQEELGDVLFSVVNLSRKLGIDAEEALQQTNGKFVKRFTYVDEQLRARGKELQKASLEEMDELWEEAKIAL